MKDCEEYAASNKKLSARVDDLTKQLSTNDPAVQQVIESLILSSSAMEGEV